NFGGHAAGVPKIPYRLAQIRMDVRWKLSGSSPWYPLLRLAAVVVTGGVVFGAALVGATSDPHGLAAASPIAGSQLAQFEPRPRLRLHPDRGGPCAGFVARP